MKIPKIFSVCLQTLGILCLPAISAFAQEYSPQGDLTADPPARAARRISYLKGSVSPVHRLFVTLRRTFNHREGFMAAECLVNVEGILPEFPI